MSPLRRPSDGGSPLGGAPDDGSLNGGAPNGRHLRVGIMGAGWVAGARHLPAYRAHPQAEVVAIYDRNLRRARALAGKGDVPFATDHIDDFLQQDLDLVSICTPPFVHEEQAIAALEAGSGVFLEKPMAMNLEGAQAIAHAASSHDRLLCVSHNFLYSRSMQRLLGVIERGEAGPIRFVMGMQSSSPRRRLPSWYGDLPAGLFFDESPHLLYLMSALLGELELVSATAERAEPGARQPVRSVHAVLSSSSAPATLTMCFDAPLSEWHLVVICERRVLLVDLFRDISVVLGSDRAHGALDILKTSAMAGMQHVAGIASSGLRVMGGRQHWGHHTLIHRVVDAVRSGQPGPIPVSDSLRVVGVTDAILDAVC